MLDEVKLNIGSLEGVGVGPEADWKTKFRGACLSFKAENISHSKRSAALISQSLELSFGHVVEPNPLRTQSEGEGQTR